MFRKWYSIVFGLRNRAAAVSRVVRPAARRSAICSSCGVRSLRLGQIPLSRRLAGGGELGPGHFRPRVGAEAVKDVDRGAELLAGPDPLPLSSQPGADAGEIVRPVSKAS